jgi:phosphate starvation-inducible PhoH-like protein
MARPIQSRAQPGSESEPGVITAEIEVTDPALLLRLSGPGGAHLRILEKELGVGVGMRGHTIHVHGAEEGVHMVQRVVADIVDVLSRGAELSEVEIARAVRTLHQHPDVRLRDLFDDVVLVASRRKLIAPKGVAQQVYIRAIMEHDVVFGVGPAGTGKTYLAMAMAVRALQNKRVKRIILTRPAVEAGEKLGFLPGDLAEKVNPYLRPLYDALHDMMDMDKAQALLAGGVIEVAPLAFMRGRTLNDSFVILDEAQNSTSDQMKMFLTRLGFESKAVITGDVTQVDLPEGRTSGLHDAAELLGRIDGIRVCWFSDADVVRHPLVQQIVRAYDERDALREQRRAEAAAHPERGESSPDAD